MGDRITGVAPELSIIIVNWNAGDLLSRCVKSIINSKSNTDFEVVVVDNASEDDSLALLHADQFSSDLIRVVRNTDNKGFGSANNQAFALTSTPFVLLLNPDTEVGPDAIDKLIETIKTDRKIGVCGPKLLNPDGSNQISVYFNPPRAWHTLLWQMKLYLLLPRRIRGELLLGRHWNHNQQRDVPMVTGAAMLIRREVIEEVGGFNEQFHMYGEDHEWCWRIRRAGWRLVFTPEAVVVHHGSQSSYKRWSTEDKIRVQLDSEFRFSQIALSRWSLIANQLANYVVVSAQIGLRSVSGIDVPTLRVVRNIHVENLKRSLRRKNRAGSN